MNPPPPTPAPSATVSAGGAPRPGAPPAPPGPARGPWLGAPGSARRTVSRNALWIWGVFLANGLALFLLAKYLVGALGDPAYGLWSFVLQITGYLGLADLGVRPAVVHFVARHDALGDLAGLNRHVNAAFRVFAWGGLAFVLLSLGLAAWIPTWGGLGPVAPSTAVAVVLLIGLEVGLTLPLNAYTAVLIGRQRIDVICRIDLAVLGLRTAATVALVEAGYGLVALAAAHALGGLVEMAWKTRASFRALPGLRFAPRSADRASVRALLGYGLWAFFIAVATLLTWQTDALVIGSALSLAAVTHFALPASLAAQARSVLWAACRALAPAAGALEARGDRAEVTRLLVSGGRLMLYLAGPMLAYMAALGEPFLARWLNDGYRGEAAAVLLVMALGVAAPIASHPLVQVLYGINRLKPLALVVLAEGLLNLALSVALVRPLGIVGVALGTAVPAVLVHAVLLPGLVAKDWGLSWARLTLATWALPLAAGLATWGALTALSDRRAGYGWWALVGYALLAVALQVLAVTLLRAVAAWDARRRPAAVVARSDA